MSASFTKSTARNIFYGGSTFFFLLFLALTFQTERSFPQYDNRAAITDQVVRGKKIWETNNCIGCHTMLGEGAYFAPELGNVYPRRGPEFIKAWMKAQPSKVPGRRQMPNFGLTDDEYRQIADFLLWTNTIRAQNWPPNDAG